MPIQRARTAARCIAGLAGSCQIADTAVPADQSAAAPQACRGTLAGLSLAPEHRRGHGALYDAVSHGRIQVGRLRRALAGLPLPAWPDGRIKLAVDVSTWTLPNLTPWRFPPVEGSRAK